MYLRIVNLQMVNRWMVNTEHESCESVNQGASGDGTHPSDLLKRCGVTEEYPRHLSIPTTRISALHVKWDDNRTSWISPKQIETHEVEIDQVISVKWGKKKVTHHGTVIGIEELPEPVTTNTASNSVTQLDCEPLNCELGRSGLPVSCEPEKCGGASGEQVDGEPESCEFVNQEASGDGTHPSDFCPVL